MADFLKVEEVLNYLDIKEDALVSEFGCGSALFALSLAKKIPHGRVYALDIQEEKLSALKGKLAIAKINNVQTILCDLEAPLGSTLPDNYLDLVLIPNILFQAEDKYAILKEGLRILKKGGQILVIDWLAGSPLSPKTGLVDISELKKVATELGLNLQKEFSAGDYHFALIFLK